MPTVSLTDLISQAKDDNMGFHIIALDYAAGIPELQQATEPISPFH